VLDNGMYHISPNKILFCSTRRDIISTNILQGNATLASHHAFKIEIISSDSSASRGHLIYNNNNTNNSIQFNSIYLCAKLNSPEANYKVSRGKKMGRVISKKVSENNVLIKIKIIKYKMTMSTLLLS
jgi:hypothetical protein